VFYRVTIKSKSTYSRPYSLFRK